MDFLEKEGFTSDIIDKYLNFLQESKRRWLGRFRLERRNKMTTIYDMAKRAGFSIKLFQKYLTIILM